MKKRYIVKIEYEVTFDEFTAKPSEAKKFLRDSVDKDVQHEGFSTGLGGMFFTSRGKPTIRAASK